VLARLRSDEPVSWVSALGSWLITSRDLAVEAMRDAETFTVEDPRFSTAAVLGTSMLSLDGAEHERHRAPFAPAFRPSVVSESCRAVVVEITARVERTISNGADHLLARLADGRLSAEELVTETVVVMLGAIETSEGMTANALRQHRWS
jgi:cytochrome P450